MLEKDNNILICFYSKISEREILTSCFRTNDNFTLVEETRNKVYKEGGDVSGFLTSSIIKSQNKFFACLAVWQIFCIIYDNNIKEFGEWSKSLPLRESPSETIQTYFFEENQNIIFFLNTKNEKDDAYSINNQGELEENGFCFHNQLDKFSYYFLSYNNSSKDYHLITNNDNNENSFDNDLNDEEIENKEIINKNINDTNFFESEILDNKKQNLHYEESNFNFYVIDQGKIKGKRKSITEQKKEENRKG